MSHIRLVINGHQIDVPPRSTILEAARKLGFYIPTLCHHPDLPPAIESDTSRAIYQGDRKVENAMPGEPARACGLCVVEVEGEKDLMPSCSTEVKNRMIVLTENDRVRAKRRETLIPILARHRHACLTCAQQEGCSRSQCSSNVPETERCCNQFGHCELQDVANYVGISPTTPKWVPTAFPVLDREPLIFRDYNLCIGCTRCVRACRNLRGVEAIGFVWDGGGQVQVGSVAPTLKESACKFCAACVHVCPTGALADKRLRLGKEKENLVPCIAACPARIDVPGYLRLIAEGKREEACAAIREQVPFPGILGRACFHPCEEACRRGELNEPLAICALKRYAADGNDGPLKEHGKPLAETGKRVAVVGAGPAGLTAAFYLRKQGHRVTVFERRSKAGGMMRFGIPRYRLPEDLLDREIRSVFDLGVEFRACRSLGKDFTLEQLKHDGYEAIFLALGAQSSRRIPLEGANHPDVFWGLDFLERMTEGEEVFLKERVLVVGGGSVAVDVARTALRRGAREVTMVCLEKREEMPAQGCELEGAIREGVRLIHSWGPRRIVMDNGSIKGLELIRCVSVVDDRGVFSPSFNEVTQMVEGNQVILAVGQLPELSFLEADCEADKGMQVTRGLIVVEQETLQTGLEGVYAGGDVTNLPGAIVLAIAAGRKAASAMDRALGGSGEVEGALSQRGAPSQYLGRHEGFASRPREKLPELPIERRREGFDEVCQGFTDERALREAARCLQCDLRLTMGCNPAPPKRVVPFDQGHVREVPEEEGVFILYDCEHKVLAIEGTVDLRKELIRALKSNGEAAWFEFEPDRMYSKRQSELIQKYVQEHGQMPGGGRDEDLF